MYYIHNVHIYTFFASMLTMLMVQLDNMFHRAILFTLNVCQTFNNSRFYKYDENDHYVNFKNVDKVIKLTTFITG